MAKLTQEIRDKIKEYCLNSIDSDDEEFSTDKEKLQYAMNRFKSEYGHMIKRVGQFKAFSEWLQGLALNIAYYNCDILELAKEWGQTPKTEREEDKILEQWWDFMTNQYFKLFKAHKVI